MEEKVFIGRADSDIVPWFDCVVGDTRYITSPSPIDTIANIKTPTLLPSPQMKDALTGLRDGARVIITHVPEYYPHQGQPQKIVSHMYYTGQTPYRLITRSWKTNCPYLQPEIDIQVIPITFTLTEKDCSFMIPLFHDMTLEGVGLITSLLPKDLLLYLSDSENVSLIDGGGGFVTVENSEREEGCYFSLNAKTTLDTVRVVFGFTEELPPKWQQKATLVLYGKPSSIFTSRHETTDFPWVNNSTSVSSLAECRKEGWVIEPPVKQTLTKVHFEIQQYVQEPPTRVEVRLYKVTKEDWLNKKQLRDFPWTASREMDLNLSNVEKEDLVLDPGKQEILVATFRDVTGQEDHNADLRLRLQYSREED